MKILFYGLLFLLGIYLLLGLLLFVFQSRVLFFPEKLPADYSFYFNADFEEKFFQVDEEVTLHALHFFAEKPKGVILYFHGNAGSLDGWGQIGEEFVPLGYDVLISDFRGFGKSTGAPNESAFYQDAQMLYDFLLEKYPAENIVIYGRSIGTGVAVDLAAKNKIGKLILETPFLNLAKLAKENFKIFPVKALLRFRFPNDEKIKEVAAPIHIFHGTQDELIPFQHAQQFAQILEKPNSLTLIEGGGHNNLSAFPAYWNSLKSILQ